MKWKPRRASFWLGLSLRSNWKLVPGQRSTWKKKTADLHELSTWARNMVTWYWSADTLFWQVSIDHGSWLGVGQFWVHMFPWFISYASLSYISFTGTYEPPAPNVSGFIAQLVERRTGIARSRVQAPLKSWIFFRLLYAIAKIAIITARIILHLISYPQFTYDLFHMHHSPYISFTGTYEPKIDLLPTSVAS